MDEAIEARAFAKAYFAAYNMVVNQLKYGAVSKYPPPHETLNITRKMQTDIDRIIDGSSTQIEKVASLIERLKDTAFGKHVEFIATLENDHGASEHQTKAEAQAEAQALMKLKTTRDASAIQAASAALPRYYKSLDKPMSASEWDYQRTHPSGTYTYPEAAAAAPLANPLTIAFHKSKSKKRGGKKSYKKSHKKGGKKRSHRRRRH